ncbi:MAG TPA: hypothetical protein VMI56_11655 [Reyranella sp.]|nr:hypothetical protein [Reyranella sp.]
MSFIAKPARAVTAAALLLALQAPNAFAAGNEACREYAVSAIRQVHLMHEHPACNRGNGPRWSDDWNAHYEWCRGVSFEALAIERDARTNWLRACGG